MTSERSDFDLANGALQDVSCETVDRLHDLAALVVKWNKSINLVSRASEVEIWRRHIHDSAQLFRGPSDENDVWLDIGSGGGFPGLVLAVIAKSQAPDRSHILVESDQRKATFLREVSRQLGLRVTVHTKRIEQLEPQRADVITARAVASLRLLLPWICRHTKPGGIALLLKGAEYRSEVTDALADWQFEFDAIPSATNSGAAVLVVREPKRRVN
jgi:16S rRNA (guanine527-N7)-methyltransferase